MGFSDRDSSIDATSTLPPALDCSSTSGMAYSSASWRSSVATCRWEAYATERSLGIHKHYRSPRVPTPTMISITTNRQKTLSAPSFSSHSTFHSARSMSCAAR